MNVDVQHVKHRGVVLYEVNVLRSNTTLADRSETSVEFSQWMKCG